MEPAQKQTQNIDPANPPLFTVLEERMQFEFDDFLLKELNDKNGMTRKLEGADRLVALAEANGHKGKRENDNADVDFEII